MDICHLAKPFSRGTYPTRCAMYIHVSAHGRVGVYKARSPLAMAGIYMSITEP